MIFRQILRSTIAFERRFNAALRPRSRAEFVAFMLDNLPPPPPEHERIRHANRAGHAPHPTGH